MPLIDVAMEDGPTAFRLGSHVKPEGGMWDRGGTARAYSEVSLAVKRGSLVLFDLRLDHRGGANRGDAARPILYLGFTNRWYRDVSNFVEPHTREWSQLGSRVHKALYARLDAQEYVRRLEAALEAKGGDVAALKARDELRRDGGEAAHNLLL